MSQVNGPEEGETEVGRAFRVRGRVQGVGFRWWTRREAERLGLRGRVRNLPDGDVWVEATGPQVAVEGLARRLRHGPPAAVVTEVREAEPTKLPPPVGFVIDV